MCCINSVCLFQIITTEFCYFSRYVSLFACSSQSTLDCLQRVHDAAARLLCGASARTHAPLLLKQLHWLPVSSRIQFKLYTLMFDINRGTISVTQNSSGAVMTLSPVCEATSSFHVLLRTRLHVTDKAFPSPSLVPGMHCHLT